MALELSRLTEVHYGEVYKGTWDNRSFLSIPFLSQPIPHPADHLGVNPAHHGDPE